MASLSDRLRAEGMEKGRQEGVEGILRKQIQLKFGSLPAWVDERLASATDEQLDVWVTGILSAETLDALFSGNN